MSLNELALSLDVILLQASVNNQILLFNHSDIIQCSAPLPKHKKLQNLFIIHRNL